MKFIRSIKTYKLYQTKIYLSDVDNQFSITDNDLNIKYRSKELGIFPNFFSSDKYIANGYGKTFCLSQNSFIELGNKYSNIINDIGIEYRNYNGVTHDTTLFHLPEEKQILKEWLPNSIYHIQDQYWCNDTKEDFKLIDVERKEILWAIPQPEVVKPYGYNGLTNIKKVLGIYKGNLWLQLPDSRIRSIELETGKINNEIEHFYFSAISEGIFLSQIGRIIIFHYNIYAEYSLENNEFIIDKIISNENQLIIRNVLFRENDMQLYFTGNKDNSFEPNVYGIFNKETFAFDFIGEGVAENGWFYQSPQVNDELFTILDSKGNLIIHKMQDI